MKNKKPRKSTMRKRKTMRKGGHRINCHPAVYEVYKNYVYDGTKERVDILPLEPKYYYKACATCYCSMINRPFEELYLYSMQLPDQKNKQKREYLLGYLMYVNDVNKLVDLHCCGSIPTQRDCNPDDPMAEYNTWNELKDLCNLMDVEYICYQIQDMTAGTIETWEKIALHPDTKEPQNCTALHCLGGFGRSGSLFLFFTIRDYPSQEFQIIRDNLDKPFFGYSIPMELMNVFRKIFSNPVGIDTNPELRASGMNFMGNELFSLSQLKPGTRNGIRYYDIYQEKQYRFVERLNCIIHALVFYFKSIGITHNKVCMYKPKPPPIETGLPPGPFEFSNGIDYGDTSSSERFINPFRTVTPVVYNNYWVCNPYNNSPLESCTIMG